MKTFHCVRCNRSGILSKFMFHTVVADHTSLLMHAREFPYMAYMLVNYALFL